MIPIMCYAIHESLSEYMKWRIWKGTYMHGIVFGRVTLALACSECKLLLLSEACTGTS